MGLTCGLVALTLLAGADGAAVVDMVCLEPSVLTRCRVSGLGTVRTHGAAYS